MATFIRPTNLSGGIFTTEEEDYFIRLANVYGREAYPRISPRIPGLLDKWRLHQYIDEILLAYMLLSKRLKAPYLPSTQSEFIPRIAQDLDIKDEIVQAILTQMYLDYKAGLVSGDLYHPSASNIEFSDKTVGDKLLDLGKGIGNKIMMGLVIVGSVYAVSLSLPAIVTSTLQTRRSR